MLLQKKSGRVQEVAESAIPAISVKIHNLAYLSFCNVVGMQMHNTYLSIRFQCLSPRSPLLNDLNAFHLCIIGSTPFLRYTSSFCFCAWLFCIVPAVFLFLFCKIFLVSFVFQYFVKLWSALYSLKIPKGSKNCEYLCFLFTQNRMFSFTCRSALRYSNESQQAIVMQLAF